MTDYWLTPTPSTPEVYLSPTRGLLTLRGESYPENVLTFYGPLLERLRAALESGQLDHFQVELHISYYNSATANVLHRILQILDKAAEEGCLIRLLWHYDEEDDMARELGQNLKEDFPSLLFQERPIALSC